MPAYKANAIILRRIPLGETDKILTLYTREYGKLAAVAKGARRTTSRIAGASEPLMFLRALLADGRNFDVLTQAEIRESFPMIRTDFNLFLRATYACEVIDRVSEERDPSPEAFDLLLSTLYVLQRAVDPDATLHSFELRLMSQMGYEPQLSACAVCDRPLDDTAGIIAAGFSPERGGTVCNACGQTLRNDLLPLSPDTNAWMQYLVECDDARALARVELAPVVREEMNRVLRSHLRYRLERDIRSTAFLDASRVGALQDIEQLSANFAAAAPSVS